MEKIKQISEIANIIHKSNLGIIDPGCCGDCSDCWCQAKAKAMAIYDADYRKITGDDYVSTEWHNEQVLHLVNEIERTCENIAEMHPTDGFTCSKCGITLVDFVEERVDDEYHASYYEYRIKYCPNCGAKVVEE